ncbi:MAG: hypothetical protein AAFX50_04380 [Acidobacteriota bacterium]
MPHRRFCFVLLASLLTLLALPSAFAQGGLSGGGGCLGGGLGGGLGGFCCGDGVCEPGEVCSADCSVASTCGDGVCSQQETCGTCSADCGACGFCGDGVCNGTESCATCSDCTSCFAAPFQAFYRSQSSSALRTATAFDGTDWAGDTSLGGASSARGPAAVKFNDRIFVFYRGNSNDTIYVSWSEDGVIWSGNRVLGNGAETKEGVAATVFNNRIYVFSKGKSSKAIWMSSSSNGFTWSAGDHRKIVSDSNGTTGPPAAVAFDGKIEVHYRHDNSTVKHVTSSNGLTWTAGTDLNEDCEEGVALAVFDDTLYMTFATTRFLPYFTTYKGYEHRLGIFSKAAGGDWGAVTWVRDAETERQPALAASDNRLVVLYKGLHSNKLFYSYSDDGDTWYGDLPAVGQTKNGGPALVYTD